jgi:hypothetical protein
LDPVPDPIIEGLKEPNIQTDIDRKMPEPVSAVEIFYLAGYAALQTYGRSSSAVSSEARAAQEAAAGVVRSAEQSQALFGEKAAALSKLWKIATECNEPDWDGAGAVPVDLGAVGNAGDFVRALPGGIPLPESSPEPDGAVSLDWIVSRNRIFSISVGTGSRLAYAWLDGSDRGHGVAQFDGGKIPARVLEGILGTKTGRISAEPERS